MPSGFEIVSPAPAWFASMATRTPLTGLPFTALITPLTVAQYAADPKESTSVSDNAMKNRSWRMEFADAGTGSYYWLPLHG